MHRTMKTTCLLVVASLFLLPPLAAQDTSGTEAKNHDLLFQKIKCDEADQRFISDTYDAFLTILAKREIGKEKIRFPARMASQIKRGETHTIICWSYYITPDESRGFELAIPKDSCTENDGFLTTTTDLVIARQDRKQGVEILVLKPKNL